MMRRRDFIKTSVTAAGAVMLGVGCGSDDETGLLPGTAFFPQSVASGDPKASSVVLWTRILDSSKKADATLQVQLEVATSPDFKSVVSLADKPQLTLNASAQYNHCIKARITDLTPHTTYYYRFIYTASDGKSYASNTGRTKTAPSPDADAPVKFAVVSCQDYNGRYYNTMRRLAKEEIDFVVHLGDYIYETTGDSSFQNTSEERAVTFSKPEQAIVFNQGQPSEYYAAKSLSNYRDCYQIFRSDKDLQRLHENFPFIVIWDDHEFSDDCYQATGTYFDGAQDETDVPRRQAANQAWYEFMPVDFRDQPEFKYDSSILPPNDISIYRDFVFGKNMHLVMTDLRSYRTDHPIPEKSAPWSVPITQDDLTTYSAQLSEVLGDGQSPDDFTGPYIENLANYASGEYYGFLQQIAPSFGVPGSEVDATLSGNISVDFINLAIAGSPDGVPVPELISDETLPRGIAFHHMNKTSYFGALGSRQLVVVEPYQIYVTVKYLQTNSESENAMGDTQREWFTKTMSESTSLWKVWGSEFVFSPLAVDVRGLGLPAAFDKRFYPTAEDWHSLSNERQAILEELSALENVVIVSGDMHSFLASALTPNSTSENGIIEFATGGLASKNYRDLLTDFANSNETLRDAGAAGLAYGIDLFFQNKDTRPNPHLGFADSSQNGFVVIEATSQDLTATYHMIAGSLATKDLVEQELNQQFSTQRFRVVAGTYGLQSYRDGGWKTWSPSQHDWVG